MIQEWYVGYLFRTGWKITDSLDFSAWWDGCGSNQKCGAGREICRMFIIMQCSENITWLISDWYGW